MPLTMDSEMLKLFRRVKEMGACMALTLPTAKAGGILKKSVS